MDMYDPITHRRFGIAFHALMNILKDKAKRDRLHAIFQELMLPYSSEEPKFQGNSDGITDVQQSDVRFDVPLKYKNNPIQGTTTNVAKADPVETNFENLRAEDPSDTRFQEPVLGTSGRFEEEPTYSISNQQTEMELKTFYERPQTSNEMQVESEVQLLQTNNLPEETSVNSPDENLEAKKRETELRLKRMKRFLDKVKNNSAAPATLQAKAERISRILAKEG